MASGERKARDYVEQLFDELRGRIFDARVDTSGEIHELAGAMRALHAIDALSDIEHSDLMAQLREILNTPDEVPRAHRVALPSDEPEGFDLQRVVAGPFEDGDGLSLVSVELYADMVGLRWNLRTQSGQDIETQLPEFHLTDNLGTPYLLRRRRAGGGLEILRGETYFSPNVPSGATYLEAKAGRHRFRVPLA
jgi:hypothetical protein